MYKTIMIAGCVAFISAMCLFGFPGGFAKANDNWLFMNADIAAISISMTVLIGMTMGPIIWKEVEVRAKKAVFVAVVFMAIAIHQSVFVTVGDDYWMRVYVNGLFTVFLVLTSVIMLFLQCVY